MERCAIFVDANLALHFLPIDQIDWNGLTGCAHCIVVIAPILLRELEKEKIFNPSSVLKRRAARTIDFLFSRLAEADPIPLRSGATLLFMEHEPAIDFAANNLVREVDDDQYIAAALTFQEIRGLPVYIASNDGGMALKLRSRSIGILRPPVELLLPAEVDAGQKELRDIKGELARLKARQPSLAVRFSEGGTLRTIRNASAIALDKPTLAQIRAEYPPLPIQPEKETKPWSGDLAALRDIGNLQGMGSMGRVERYNRELAAYLAEYETFLVEYRAWIEMLRLTSTIEVELVNEGSATATDIDVCLRFPAGATVIEIDQWPTQPDEPKPPLKPGELRDPLGIGRVVGPDLYRFPQLNVHDGAVDCARDGSWLRFSARSLKQGCVLSADKFLLTRAADLTGKGIEIEVEITLHEGGPVPQTLAMKFAEVEARESDD